VIKHITFNLSFNIYFTYIQYMFVKIHVENRIKTRVIKETARGTEQYVNLVHHEDHLANFLNSFSEHRKCTLRRSYILNPKSNWNKKGLKCKQEIENFLKTHCSTFRKSDLYNIYNNFLHNMEKQ
jgi:hypothetical protein